MSQSQQEPLALDGVIELLLFPYRSRFILERIFYCEVGCLPDVHTDYTVVECK
jgi:hypothetical protein